MTQITTTKFTGKNIRKCETCGVPFKARSANSPTRFCSKKCGGVRLKSRVIKTCVQCGGKKEMPPSHAERALNFCCSKKCSLAFRNANPALRSEAISNAIKAKWEQDGAWAEKRRAEKAAKKKPKIVVYAADDAPIVRYPFFNAAGRACAHCNRTILIRPGNKEPHVFCNRQCSGHWKAKFLVGERSPRYTKGKTVLNCAWCKQNFSRHACFIGDFDNHFCSIGHRHAWQRDPANSIPNPNSTALWPNAAAIEKRIAQMDTSSENRVSVAAKLGISLGDLTSFLKRMNVKMTGGQVYRRGDNNPLYQTRVEVTCVQCRKTTKRAPWLVLDGPMYCSRKCLHRSKWKGGTITYRGEDWGRQRLAARARDKGNCQLCGVHKGASIDVHHIRAFRLFSESTKANDLNNLVALCRSCHLKVEGTTDNGNVDTWQDEYIAHLKRKAAKLEGRSRSRRLIFLTGQGGGT